MSIERDFDDKPPLIPGMGLGPDADCQRPPTEAGTLSGVDAEFHEFTNLSLVSMGGTLYSRPSTAFQHESEDHPLCCRTGDPKGKC